MICASIPIQEPGISDASIKALRPALANSSKLESSSKGASAKLFVAPAPTISGLQNAASDGTPVLMFASRATPGGVYTNSTLSRTNQAPE
jgi:hypothetical protein